ncbi:unnamed protein product [Paramecium sonneborni]|uniref:Uncharacterized protein n=1 Tax=Paramecium sonneborni TaxID=65129 RepID=A0A8S1RSR7_9CILI|nr:unnamed protein product [Paramecium sonneborni]
MRKIINKCNYQMRKGIKQGFSGGGVYDEEGGERKFGKWIELDDKFKFDKQITYNVEYNTNGMNIGI